MSLVLGLGNPGDRYASTRHNVGWWVVDRLIDRWRARPEPRHERYATWRSERAGREVVLMKPLTFMNLSGEALDEWRTGREFAIDDLLVVADDVYLPVGALRARPSGSSGGHRGLESMERAVGAHYARLRIGVGAVASEERRDYVLDTPEGEEREALERMADVAADAVECWLDEGVLVTMNRFNRRVRKEVSEP